MTVNPMSLYASQAKVRFMTPAIDFPKQFLEKLMAETLDTVVVEEVFQQFEGDLD